MLFYPSEDVQYEPDSLLEDTDSCYAFGEWRLSCPFPLPVPCNIRTVFADLDLLPVGSCVGLSKSVTSSFVLVASNGMLLPVACSLFYSSEVKTLDPVVWFAEVWVSLQSQSMDLTLHNWNPAQW